MLEASKEADDQTTTPGPYKYKQSLERPYRISPSVNGRRSIPVSSAVPSPGSSVKKIRLTPRFGMFGRYQESPTRKTSYQISFDEVQESIEAVDAEEELNGPQDASDEDMSRGNPNEDRVQGQRGDASALTSPVSAEQSGRSTGIGARRLATRKEVLAAASQAGYRELSRPKKVAGVTAATTSHGKAMIEKPSTTAKPKGIIKNANERILRSKNTARGQKEIGSPPADGQPARRLERRPAADGSADDDESGRQVLVNWKGKRIVLPKGGGYVVIEKPADGDGVREG